MDGLKSFPGKQTVAPGLFSTLRMDGWMIAIIGFKLPTKGRDICSISNVEQNMIPDSGSYRAKSLAFGKGAEKLEGILRVVEGRGTWESKMLT